MTNTRIGSRIDKNLDRKVVQRLHGERLSESIEDGYFLGSERHDRMFTSSGVLDSSAHAVAGSNVRGNTKGRYTQRSNCHCPHSHALNIIKEREPQISRHFVATQKRSSGKADPVEISQRMIDRPGASSLRKESV